MTFYGFHLVFKRSVLFGVNSIVDQCILLSTHWKAKCIYEASSGSKHCFEIWTFSLDSVSDFMDKMNGGLSGLYSEAKGIVHKVLVSAENLQLTLSSDFTLEEHTLRCHHRGCLEAKTTGY